MSTVFSEEEAGMLESKFAIVKSPQETTRTTMPDPGAKALADYVLRVMREKNLSYPDVEKMAKRRKGGPAIGKSTVQMIAQAKTPNPGIITLVELAWGLGKPVEEVISVILGADVTESPGFQRSEAANIWEMSRQLPLQEQRYVRRFLQMLESEIQRVLLSGK